jgi:DNA-binding CsgD family transcriptional regulator
VSHPLLSGPVTRCTTCTRSNAVRTWDSPPARARELLDAARIDAEQGREADCRRRVDLACALSHRNDDTTVAATGAAILGLLELGQGGLFVAAGEFQRCARLAVNRAGAHRITFAADYVEVLLALGDRRRAHETASSEQARSDRAGTLELRASAARCRARLADPRSYAAEFDVAVALQRSLPRAFDLGRTHLAFGERLRRDRRRRDAREQLQAALKIFVELDAMPWVERARRELATLATGRRLPLDASLIDDLTSQETRVALIIASGVSNREAAAQLFLSPKTIEAHLARAYRKLGVHNRAQLVTALAQHQRL